jgi:FO synthase
MVQVHEPRRALARARYGKSLSLEEVEALLAVRGTALEDLCEIASALRDLGHGRTITYSRKVLIPLTMLCRDHCRYCTFAKAPAKLDKPFLAPEEVVAIAEAGRRQECKEAMFTLGDRPEERYPIARRWLAERGYHSTLDYLRAVSIKVIEETGLLPHLNPGVMTWEDMARLKHVSASMGLMLETSSERLSGRGGPHFGSPDKLPGVRLRTIEAAGRLSIPFTTGILVGIGENLRERAESLFALRELHRKYWHIQEVVIQNFTAKPGTAMRHAPEPAEEEFLATVAVARIVFGPSVNVQAPPDLHEARYPRLTDAGINDWGGALPVPTDHVNPGTPLPNLRDLERRTAETGYRLRERLAIYPEYALKPDPWIAGKMQEPIRKLAGPDGLAAPGIKPEPTPWQEPKVRWKPRTTALTFAKGPGTGLRVDAQDVYGSFDAIRVTKGWVERQRKPPERLATEIKQALSKAANGRPDDVSDEEALALFEAEGEALEALARVADDLRRATVGDDITYVINRNINFTNVCYTGCRFCAFAQREVDPESYTLSLEEVAGRAQEAWDYGATEVCIQGGLHPSLPGDFYFRILDVIKAKVPDIHIHAFSPMEVLNGSTRLGISFREFLEECKHRGLGTIPGTAAELLDDEVRWVLTKGKLPADSWEEIVKTAHSLGIRSSSTIMYGHVDAPPHWTAHIRRLARIQDQTGGFTEFVPLPFVWQNSPIYLAGKARPGPTLQENRCMHAVGRILLHGRIPSVQVSWVKMGMEYCKLILRGGANDFGGTLMEETISRMAGAEWGIRKEPEEFIEAIREIGRTPAERTTTYERVRRDAARAAKG